MCRHLFRKLLPYFEKLGLKVFPVSAATGEGIPPLLDEIARKNLDRTVIRETACQRHFSTEIGPRSRSTQPPANFSFKFCLFHIL